MIDVLIISDNQFRDILQNKLLTAYLKRKGLNVKIYSKSIYRTAIEILKPQLVIVPRITDDFDDIFELKKKNNFKLFFIPCEHGSGDRSRILSFIKSYSNKNKCNGLYHKKYKYIDKIFVPSDFYKNTLLENNLLDGKQILVSGTVNSDLWFKNVNKLFINKNIFKEKTIGIATSFKSFMFTTKYESIQKGIYTINSFQKKNEMTFENQKEDLYFFLHEMYQFMILSKIINDNKSLNFSIRVHPGENIENIKYLSKKIKNISIDRNPIVNEWISNQKIILAFSSTLIFDAYYSNIPICSLSKLVPKDFIDIVEEVKKPLNTEFVFQPKNFTELYEKINSSEINYSEIFNNQKRINIESTSLKNFNFPRKNSAFKTVGNEVLKFIENKKISSLQKFFLYFKILMVNLKQIKASNFLFKYSFVMSDKSYNPLKIYNNLKVNKVVKLIINELNN
jgi:surface carbohydrate biosynthesis protein